MDVAFARITNRNCIGESVSTLPKLFASPLSTYGFMAAPFVIPARAAHTSVPTVWMFDRLDNIGGLVTHAEGNPTLINTPVGKALKFNGISDALFMAAHPLAGDNTFTFEAVSRCIHAR